MHGKNFTSIGQVIIELRVNKQKTNIDGQRNQVCRWENRITLQVIIYWQVKL